MAGAPYLEAFLDAAKYFIGLKESGNNTFTDPRGREMLSLYGNVYYQDAWCAVFISACAQKAGIAGTLIKKQAAAGWLQESTVLYCGGTWIDGPYINGGNAVTPMPGDIISFSYQAKYSGHGHASHVGIVEYVEDGKVHTIEGNTSDQCKRKEYDLGYSAINCYVRPDWVKVGDDISAYLSGVSSTMAVGPLYQNRNDRHDMTMRQVGYLNNNYELSNSASGVAISVINYTSVLGDLWDMFAPTIASLSGVNVDTSQLTSNRKIAVDYLLSMGFSASSACGVMGCLMAYSTLNPSLHIKYITNTYSWGICAWDDIRKKDLVSKLGDTWNQDLTGQLQYLLDDLDNRFKTLVAIIKSKPLDEDSVKQVVKLFMASYNPRYTSQKYVDNAEKYALDGYSKLIITQTSIVGSAANMRDKAGNQLTSQYSVTIPSSVPQTGIIDDYTSYSAWYSRWHGSSPQKKLAVMWGEQGYPSGKGIAMIGGYYCVAVRPKFGRCGEVIVVTLDGGISFPAIICDEKGEDAGSEWGHVKGSGNISLIEWERVKTENGKVKTGTSFTDVDSRGFSDWYGKKVVNITNYGKYVSVGWG